MDTTETKNEPGSGAAQADDDANMQSGTSPPPTDDPSIHQAEEGKGNG